jgi:hypothetical protein
MDETVAVLVGALIGALFGAVVTGIISFLLAQNQIKTERKNIAKALLNEITNSEKGITNFNKIKSTTDISKIPYLLVPNELTYSTDMYFDYEKDIAAFNPNLSRDLYQYHRYLCGAESCRVDTNSFFEKWKNLQNQKLTQPQQELMKYYVEGAYANTLSMIFCMNQAEQLLPNLKNELHNEITG